jgi:hypothetical protein
MRKNFAVTVTALLLSLPLGGCDALGIDDHDGERERLERSERQWSQNAPARYHFVLERLCFCPQEIVSAVEIGVEGGAVVSRRYVSSGEPVPAQWATLFPTMEGVFDVIAEALDRSAERIDVSYDSRYGFPVRASIDYIVNAIDDELDVRVRAFTPY